MFPGDLGRFSSSPPTIRGYLSQGLAHCSKQGRLLTQGFSRPDAIGLSSKSEQLPKRLQRQTSLHREGLGKGKTDPWCPFKLKVMVVEFSKEALISPLSRILASLFDFENLGCVCISNFRHSPFLLCKREALQVAL